MLEKKLSNFTQYQQRLRELVSTDSDRNTIIKTIVKFGYWSNIYLLNKLIKEVLILTRIRLFYYASLTKQKEINRYCLK